MRVKIVAGCRETYYAMKLLEEEGRLPQGLKPPYFRTGFSFPAALRVVPSAWRYTAVFLR